jgi:hypothetical protein
MPANQWDLHTLGGDVRCPGSGRHTLNKNWKNFIANFSGGEQQRC